LLENFDNLAELTVNRNRERLFRLIDRIDRESLLSDRPFDMPTGWIEWVNAAQTEIEIEALRKRVNRETPYGTEKDRDCGCARIEIYTSVPRRTENGSETNEYAKVKGT